MVHETTTSLSPAVVLARATSFFAERVPHNAAFPEHRTDRYLQLRGQGGEEISLAVMSGAGGTRVRASTLFFDQAIGRFFSTLPAPAEVA